MTTSNLERRREYMREYMRTRRGSERPRIPSQDSRDPVNNCHLDSVDPSESVNTSPARGTPAGLRRVERPLSLIGSGVTRYQLPGDRCPKCIDSNTPATDYCYGESHPTYVSTEVRHL